MEYWICMLLAKYLLQTLCSLQSANSVFSPTKSAPASIVFLSQQISTSHQPRPTEQSYYKKIKERAEHDTIYLRMIRL